jgi:alcohol dehydrogenase class IV
MACCHYYDPSPDGDSAFTVDSSRITFGAGCLAELGDRARALGAGRVALFTDARVREQPWFANALASLEAAGADVVVYHEVRVEPTDRSFLDAVAFARETRPDVYVSIGGGSVMDTCKAANLYATHPADFLTYVNAPVGGGQPVPGPLAPHIACPTTCGTGSECTGIAVFDLLSMEAKTGIASRMLRPTEALIDPVTTHTLPTTVLAASAFDVLSHAAESYTAIPHTRRAPAATPTARPMSQGANPWSDMGCREALQLLGRYMLRAVTDAADTEAREQLMWAATLAGIAFGNAGVHVPHGMSYAVAGLVRDFHAPDYPDGPIVPHGMSVIVNAPAVFRWLGALSPERHLAVATWLGADADGAGPEDAGAVLSGRLEAMMRAAAFPNGLAGVGYAEADVPALVAGTLPQQRLLRNAPTAVDAERLGELFRTALSYW